MIYTRWAVSPAILLHLKLLAQMVGHFYEAKQREQVQRQNAYTHAIYETGARLTHDVKNLLQSLKSLCAAAASEHARAGAGAAEPDATATAADHATAQHHAGEAPRAERATGRSKRASGGKASCSATAGAHRLRAGGYAHVARARGAFRQRCRQPHRERLQQVGVRVQVSFSAADGGVLHHRRWRRHLGAPGRAAVPGPVPSLTGFGIGLYQSAKLASHFGYRLSLETNRAGSVRFALMRAAEMAGPAERQVA